MFSMKCALFLCLSLFALGAHSGKVSFIDPCHWKDSDCLLKSSKKAMPFLVHGNKDLDLPSMDPLNIKEVDGTNGDMKLLFKNLVVKRLAECTLIKVVRPDRLKISIELECPITATGQYKLSGSILFIEVYGDDDFEITTEKMRISVDVTMSEFEKDGLKYYKFASYDFKYEPVEIFKLNFKRLYNGDEAKAKPVIELMTQHWKEMIQEIGKPLIEKVMTHCVKGIGNIFKILSVNEIELD